jgi:CheY-like chemotaxis protein
MEHRILVVDDIRDSADSLARLIRNLGYDSQALYSGQEAIAETAAFAPDMVLLDVGMPGLDGYETVKAIRQQRGAVHVIIVAVTGKTTDEDKQQAYAAGFDLHIAKPMNVQKLKELLALLDPDGVTSSVNRDATALRSERR